MKSVIYIPESAKEAGAHIRLALARPLDQLQKTTFVKAWSSVAYLFPGFHPDGFKDAASGWPRVLQFFAAEAWRRADAGDLDDAELYPSDAQWSGLYDQMNSHTFDEVQRRRKLASLSSECANA